MNPLPRLAARLFNAPLLVLPETASTIAANLADRFGLAPDDGAGSASPKTWSEEGDAIDREDDAPYAIHDGIATLRVAGELINRGSWVSSYSGLVAYETLSAALRQAEADPNVRGILLDIDSPGGEATGAMETAAVIRDIATVKPVKAFVDGMAASAAYALAAGATDITVTPSSTLGSIGVVMLHLDRSQAMDRAGVKPTLVHAGAHKIDGHPFGTLDEAVRSRIQARIDGVYDLFVASVAGHRPMTEAAIRGTEAGLYMGEGAVRMGLADRVGTIADVLAAYPVPSAPSAGLSSALQGSSMTMPTETLSRANHEAALAAAVTTARAESRAEGLAAGAAAERARLAGILGCPEAEGREASARHLALATTLDVEAARGALAGLARAAEPAPSPAPPAAPPKTHRLDAIVPRPPVGADHGDGDGPQGETEQGAAAFARVLGRDRVR